MSQPVPDGMVLRPGQKIACKIDAQFERLQAVATCVHAEILGHWHAHEQPSPPAAAGGGRICVRALEVFPDAVKISWTATYAR